MFYHKLLSKLFGRLRNKSDYQLLMQEFEKRYRAVNVETRDLLNLAMIERMMPTLRTFAAQTGREIAIWEDAVETLWKVAKGELDSATVSGLAKKCNELIPHDGETDSDLETFAQNAVINIAGGLDHLLDRDPTHTVLIGSNLYDCVDGFAQFDLVDCPDNADTYTQPDEVAIASHPIVRQEVNRQFEDLSRLESVVEFNSSVIQQLYSDWHPDQRQMFVLANGR